MRDIPLWVIVAAFIGWELYAHFIGKNRSAHTLSNRIWELYRRYGNGPRALVALAVALLFTHLVFQVP